jgi:hypothetical protein
MKKFVKNTELVLVNGGYLSLNAEGNPPVTNEAFIAAQKRAEYICTFAKLAKGKDFKGKKADSLDELKSKVAAELATKDTVFVKAPKKVDKPMTQKLADEAMAFMKYEDSLGKNEKINKFLQEFNILNEFEEFGLFFEDGIVKLNKIYSLKEVVEAVKSTVDLLD